MNVETPDTEPLKFTGVARGDNGPREAVATVLRDADAYAELLEGEPPTDPPIDWATEVVTAVALGARPSGTVVRIEEIRFYHLGIRGGTVDVMYREVPGDGDDDRVTYPYHAVRSSSFGHAFFHPIGVDDVPSALFRDWRGPIRTDDDGVGTYLPREDAPLSRSVAGSSVEEDGAFTAVHDGPADGPVSVPGRWQATADGLSVALDDGRAFRLDLVSVDEQELRARVGEEPSSC